MPKPQGRTAKDGQTASFQTRIALGAFCCSEDADPPDGNPRQRDHQYDRTLVTHLAWGPLRPRRLGGISARGMRGRESGVPRDGASRSYRSNWLQTLAPNDADGSHQTGARRADPLKTATTAAARPSRLGSALAPSDRRRPRAFAPGSSRCCARSERHRNFGTDVRARRRGATHASAYHQGAYMELERAMHHMRDARGLDRTL